MPFVGSIGLTTRIIEPLVDVLAVLKCTLRQRLKHY